MERVDNTVSVPESWAEYTDGNITRSQVERQKSKQLRNNTQSLLNHASEELWRQWNKVNRPRLLLCDSIVVESAGVRVTQLIKCTTSKLWVRGLISGCIASDERPLALASCPTLLA